MNPAQYDCVVIGSGPAGEGAAIKLAKSGFSVVMIDAYPQVGGGCTHWGTIPSKVLRHSIQLLADYRANPLFRDVGAQLRPGYPRLLENARSVIDQQVNTRSRHYARNEIPVLHGWARFVDAHTLQVEKTGKIMESVTARYFVIATGARPYHPEDVDFSHSRVRDSDTILELDTTPSSITIYGAGVIGCEYASIFAHLDLKVNLVNTRDRLLSFLDDEITDALSYHLSTHGTVIRHNETYQRIDANDDGVVLYCDSGKQVRADVLLWANGRTGNTRDMGLEHAGVELNHRGQVLVNDRFQTSVPHIYAAGDVVGSPGLASASLDQGRFIGWLIAEGSCDWELVKDIPTGIYTTPEISSLGQTERELTEGKVPYEVGRAFFKDIARAQITGHTVGMLKLLFHRETLEILGIHCFGEQASEIIHIGQVVMSGPAEGNSLRYFTEMTFNYPTMAEAYRVAALNGLNRLH